MSIQIENIISKSQKRTLYIVLVMILLASFFTLLYLIFVLLNTQKNMIVLDEKQTRIIGSVLFVLGIMFGIRVGKKWWYIVYEEKGRGAFLKVRR